MTVLTQNEYVSIYQVRKNITIFEYSYIYLSLCSSGRSFEPAKTVQYILHNLAHKRCKNNKKTRRRCMDVDYLEESCKASEVIVIKTVRLKLALVRDLLQDPVIGQRLQVLFLFRDPRSVMNSRWELPWCTTDDCKDPKIHCQDVEDDYASYLSLKREFPNSLHVMRFENFALAPYEEIKRVFTEINLRYSSSVISFIREHTEYSGEAERIGIYRDSRSELMPWMTSPRFTEWHLSYVQEACANIMHKLGYDFFNSLNDSAVIN